MFAKSNDPPACLASCVPFSSAPLPFALFAAVLCTFGTLHCLKASAASLPQSGQFVAGKGQISVSCAGLDISQQTSRGIIDWKGFSIGNGQTVNIHNGSGATLNRVTGRQLSLIEGQLTATGSVYLINSQGIVVGPHSTITTGGRFVASTLDIRNTDFMTASAFTFTGSSGASVVNLGRIGSTGGDVFLISQKRIVNDGHIKAAHGSAELDVGAKVLLHDSSSGQQVFVDAGSHGDVVNRGSVQAAQISLQAADGNIYALAGKHDALRATGTRNRDGTVWLVADGGMVRQQGITAAVDFNGSGGGVETVGTTVKLARADVWAAQWNVQSAQFSIGKATARMLSHVLSLGTSVALTTSGGTRSDGAASIAVRAPIRWKGDAALTLNAAKDIVVSPHVALENRGGGDLTLRADAASKDNGGSVLNDGLIDWSRSIGVVSLLYDIEGSYKKGTTHTNSAWSASAFSGLQTQLTSYELVNSVEDLNKISQKLNGNYALGKDIQVSSEPDVQLTPIGEKTLQPFSGQFDGRGHTIDAWFVYLANPLAAYDGLFYEIGPSGVVRNVGITNASIRSDGGSFDGEIGLLAGRNLGLVTNAYSTGDVGWYAIYPQASAFAVGAGGLVGVNEGTIERAWSSASVGADGMIGGLVAVNSGLVLQSYSSGYVGAAIGGRPGGLAGENDGTIMQSYSAAQVIGYYGGGLVDSNSGIIEQSYVSGFISAPILYGAIAENSSGTIASNVFWNVETTGAGVALSSGFSSAVGLSASEMSRVASFGPTWDFSSTGAWALPVGAAQPILRWQLTQ